MRTTSLEFVSPFLLNLALTSTHCRLTVTFEAGEPTALTTQLEDRWHLFRGHDPPCSRPQGHMTDSCWTSSESVVMGTVTPAPTSGHPHDREQRAVGGQPSWGLVVGLVGRIQLSQSARGPAEGCGRQVRVRRSVLGERPPCGGQGWRHQ